MRDFFRLVGLMVVPALILVIGGTYLLDKRRLRHDLDRSKTQATTERVLAANKRSAEMRDIDVGQRLAVGGSEALTQAQKETSDLLMRIDAAVQKSLSVVFGFSPSAADLATSMMAWVTSCLIGFAALFSLLQNMAPPSIRQRLITGHSGAGARTGGTFELPH